MALLKLRRFAQLTLPVELRKQFNLAEGDYIEAQAVRDGILLKPVRVVERDKARKELAKVLKEVHAKLPPSKLSPREQEELIVKEIKAHRREKQQKHYAQRGV
jgi:AbrB family looped-hinge helix DNA binding protein